MECSESEETKLESIDFCLIFATSFLVTNNITGCSVAIHFACGMQHVALFEPACLGPILLIVQVD